MKIVVRTLIILAAALLVVGATMAFAASASPGLGSLGPGRDGFERHSPAGAAEGSRPSGFLPGGPLGRGEGRDGHEGGRGMFAAFELLKNLVIIAVIIAISTLISRLTKGLRPQRRYSGGRND